MALSRKMLRAMGIEDEKIDQTIEAHTESIDALKEQRDQYKVDAEKLPALQKKLEELEAAGDDGYKQKYEEEHEALENLKDSIAKEKALAEKQTAFRELLKSVGVDPKRMDSVMRVTDLSKLEIKDGKFNDESKIAESLKTEWSDFIVTSGTKGADVENPPAGNGGNGSGDDLGEMSMADYIAARKKM